MSICYNNNTKYCPYWEECNDGKECEYALTSKVKKEIEKQDKKYLVWGYKPPCFKDGTESVSVRTI